MSLTPGHVELLRARGIPIDLADAAGLESVDGTVAGKLLAYPHPCRGGGLAIPYKGTCPPYWRVRMDGGDTRYLCPSRPVPIYVPPPFADVEPPADLANALVVVEAPLKALAMAAAGLSAVGLGGVATTLEKGRLNASWAPLELRGRDVRVLFDAGRAFNDEVSAAEKRLAKALERAGALVRVCELPPDDTGNDQGPDDYFAQHGANAIHEVVRTAHYASPWIARVQSVDSAWYSTPPPVRSWLLRDSRHPKAHGVFPLGKVGQLIGEGGASKTMALCQLAVSVATGTSWLGTFTTPEPGRVLLVLGEEDEEESRRRLYHACAVAGSTPPDDAIEIMSLAGIPCPMVESDAKGNMHDGAFATWMRDYVHNGNFRLVAIDPLSRFGGRDAEVANAAATRFIQVLESFALPRCAVWNAHHTNQGSRNGAKVTATSGRGVTALVDGARWQGALSVESVSFDSPEERERLGEVVTFSVPKSNYAIKPPPLVLRRDPDHGGALVPLDAADLQTVEQARGVDPAQEAQRSAKEARVSQREADRCAVEDAALDTIMSRSDAPTTVKAVRAALRAVIGTCSHDRADTAVARRKLRTVGP
ncbi:MAG: AAA family ATPase [Polyangiaceae bacterium]